jgi:hypothetical protein
MFYRKRLKHLNQRLIHGLTHNPQIMARILWFWIRAYERSEALWKTIEAPIVPLVVIRG